MNHINAKGCFKSVILGAISVGAGVLESSYWWEIFLYLI